MVTFVGRKVIEMGTSETSGVAGNSVNMGGGYKDVLEIIKSYICFV